jgi:hypothetical protein
MKYLKCFYEEDESLHRFVSICEPGDTYWFSRVNHCNTGSDYVNLNGLKSQEKAWKKVFQSKCISGLLSVSFPVKLRDTDDMSNILSFKMVNPGPHSIELLNELNDRTVTYITSIINTLWVDFKIPINYRWLLDFVCKRLHEINKQDVLKYLDEFQPAVTDPEKLINLVIQKNKFPLMNWYDLCELLPKTRSNATQTHDMLYLENPEIVGMNMFKQSSFIHGVVCTKNTMLTINVNELKSMGYDIQHSDSMNIKI